MTEVFPKRGEIWWIDFDPSVGEEIQKIRPAVIVSNDKSNRYAKRVQVVPITSKAQKLYAGEAKITIKNKPCKALASQLQTTSKLRFKNHVGQVTKAEMGAIESAIKQQLALT